MNCGKARKVLYLSDRLGSVSTQWLEAQKHRQGCSQCRTFFSDEEELAGFLKKWSPRVAAPPHLREKILRRIAQAQTHSNAPIVLKGTHSKRNRHFKVALCLTSILVVTLLFGMIGYRLLTRSWQEQVITALIEDHVRFRPGAYEITSSRAEQVEKWFSGKIDFAVQAPRFEAAELLGGRLCYLSGKKGALLSYQKQGIILSFYIIDGTDINLNRFKRHVKGEQLYVFEGKKGQSLILWKERGLAYVLVSDLPGKELIHLASEVKLL